MVNNLEIGRVFFSVDSPNAPRRFNLFRLFIKNEWYMNQVCVRFKLGELEFFFVFERAWILLFEFGKARFAYLGNSSLHFPESLCVLLNSNVTHAIL